jgi:hypothetical protein
MMKTPIVSCLISVLALSFSACPTTKQKTSDKKPATTAEAQPEEDASVDFQGFVGRLRKAVRAHDLNMLASMMTEDFGYRLEPEASGPGVFKYWDENNLWTELDGIISERFVPKGNYMVAPPQFADPSSEYSGYRAGIRRINGSWKFAYFVNG